MALHTLHIFDKTGITTNGPNFDEPAASQYTFGVSTVTLIPGASSQPVSVDDPDDGTFDDDDPNPQTLNGG